MSELQQDIRAHARKHVKDLTARTTELVGEVIAKGMLGVLEECITMKVRIDELEAASRLDAQRLEWMSRHGASLRQDPMARQWYVVAPYRTGISCVDDSHRFPSYQQAIDAAISSQKEGGNG